MNILPIRITCATTEIVWAPASGAGSCWFRVAPPQTHKAASADHILGIKCSQGFFPVQRFEINGRENVNPFCKP
jgi:hypothetical protein